MSHWHIGPARLTLHLHQAEGCGGRSAPWHPSIRKTPQTTFLSENMLAISQKIHYTNEQYSNSFANEKRAAYTTNAEVVLHCLTPNTERFTKSVVKIKISYYYPLLLIAPPTNSLKVF